MRWAPLCVLVAACYRPDPSPGAPCNADGTCPVPLVCTAANTCERSATDARALDSFVPADVARDAAAVSIDAAPDAPRPLIAWVDTATASIPVTPNASSITINAPASSPGDVMIGVIAIGATGSANPPTYTPPTGWTLVRQIDEANDSGLAVYWHEAGASEPASYTFQFNEMMEGVAWISTYSGVSTTSPVDVDIAVLVNTASTSYATPAITTTVPNTMIVAAYATHDAGTATTWTAPIGTSARASLNNGSTRSGLGVDKRHAIAGAEAPLTATASTGQEYALVHVMALRP